MASATPAAAIQDRFLTNWGDVTATFVGNPDDVTPPVDGNANPLPFVVLEFPGAVASQWTIGDPGNNAWREDGAFMLHIGIPSGSGDAAARDFADQLAALFRGQSFGGVTCWECNPPTPGRRVGNIAMFSFGTRYHYEYLA